MLVKRDEFKSAREWLAHKFVGGLKRILGSCRVGLLGLVLGGATVGNAQVTSPAVEAKSYEQTSSTGVSYLDGSFTYSLPLFSLGGEGFPSRLSPVLQYDSSGNVRSDSGWTISIGLKVGSMAVYAPYNTYQEQDGEWYSEPLLEQWAYAAYFSVGQESLSVQINNAELTAQDFAPATNSGYSLEFVPDASSDGSSGLFTLRLRDGSLFKARAVLGNGNLNFDASPIALREFIAASGKRMESIGPGGLDQGRYENSDGFVVVSQVVSDSSSDSIVKVCGYNLAYTARSLTSTCNASQLVSTLTFVKLPNFQVKLSSVQIPDGGTYYFDYAIINAIRGENGELHPGNVNFSARFKKPRPRLTCIREPGSNVCSVTNTYDACDGYRAAPYQSPIAYDPGWSGSRDRVTRQDFPDGTYVTYTYPNQSSPCREVTSVIEARGAASTTINVTLQNSSLVDGTLVVNKPFISSVADPLGRFSSYQFTGRNDAAEFIRRDDLMVRQTLPEGNSIEFSHDSRGNVVQRKLVAKNAGPQIISLSAFPATCSNRYTCNQPTSITDGRGAETNFTYDPTHGGVLTETGPADGAGIRRVTRNSYVQRRAWLKDEGGGFAPSPTLAWLPSETRICRTSATIGNGCAGGSDEVVTAYDYGPDSGPNNLLLRGVAVTADGQTRRTCYGYDANGRRISETGPMAGLGSCP